MFWGFCAQKQKTKRNTWVGHPCGSPLKTPTEMGGRPHLKKKTDLCRQWIPASRFATRQPFDPCLPFRSVVTHSAGQWNHGIGGQQCQHARQKPGLPRFSCLISPHLNETEEQKAGHAAKWAKHVMFQNATMRRYFAGYPFHPRGKRDIMGFWLTISFPDHFDDC